MAETSPVLWSLYGEVHSGALEVRDGRLTLKGRTRTYSVPFARIACASIDRGPASRLRGLPSLVVRLGRGDVLSIASLGGAGSLHDLHSSIDAELRMRQSV